jgi:hypothetical protein
MLIEQQSWIWLCFTFIIWLLEWVLMVQRHLVKCHHAECNYAESHNLFIVILNAILLSVITLSIIILSVIRISKNAYRTLFLDFIFYSMVA